MAANSFGNKLTLTTFGESHGPAIGGILDGFPANFPISLEDIQLELDKRKPSLPFIGSQRQESDTLEILSGIYQGKSLGTPIGFIIRNQDAQSQDYEQLNTLYRPGHADDLIVHKYHHRDPRGGGRSSARETASRVAGGAFAKLFLNSHHIQIFAYTNQIGDIILPTSYEDLDLNAIYKSIVRCPNTEYSQKMEEKLNQVKALKDSVGGCITCIIKNVPKGLGNPTFDKLNAALASAIISIPACKGFEIGEGFSVASAMGSTFNDIWKTNGESEHNYAGGIRGGIATGEDIVFRAAFKPISSIGQKQVFLNTEGRLEKAVIHGRHDVCCIPRAVPVVEAMTALVIADFML